MWTKALHVVLAAAALTFPAVAPAQGTTSNDPRKAAADKARVEAIRKRREADTAEITRAAVAALQDNNELDKIIAPNHRVLDFGKRVDLGHGSKGMQRGLAAAPTSSNYKLAPKRVLANRRMVFIQAVMSGSRAEKSADAEAFVLHWVRDKEVRETLLFIPRRSLVIQLDGGPGAIDLKAAAAPATPEIHLKPTAVVSKEILATIYGSTSAAIAARVAWTAGQHDLMRVLGGETILSNIDTSTQKKLQNVAGSMPKATITFDHVVSSGPYVVVVGRFQDVGKLNINVLTVAKTQGDKVQTSHTYLDADVLATQLGR